MEQNALKSNIGIGVEQAKKALVRYIWHSKLKVGDKFPAQEQIRKQIGLGSASVDRAIKALTRDKVLVTKRRVGTYVLNPQADGIAGWTVGLMIQKFSDTVGPFYPTLLHYLQLHFGELGCHTNIFYCNPTHNSYGVGLEFFPGLKRNVEKNKLDAVLVVPSITSEAWQWLEERGMHPCSIATAFSAPMGVFIDYESTVCSAVDDLLERGCRQPAIIASLGVSYDYILSVICKAFKGKVDADPGEPLFRGARIEGGHQIAQKLLEAKIEERPDGLIILDDQLATGLISELISELISRESSNNYLPQLICLTNKQLPVDFPIKNIIQYELDIEEMARIAVKLIMEKLKGTKTENNKIWLRPQRVVSPQKIGHLASRHINSIVSTSR